MSLSRLATEARASATMALNARAKQLTAEGADVVNFTIGEPDFDTPDYIKQAAIRAIQAGFTKYQPAAGNPELRQAIARKLQADNGLDYGPEQVFVSNGAKQALYTIMRCLLQDGDRALVVAPYWVSYVHQARFCGADVAIVDATADPELKPDPDQIHQLADENTKLLVLNSPSNPTGVVLDQGELEVIVEAALEHDLWIISDEIYEKLIYDDAAHCSPAGFSDRACERVITVNGFSKTYAMTGWRIGYAAGPEQVIQSAGRLQSHMTSGPDSIAQRAGIEALVGPQDDVAEMRQAFDKRRRLFIDGLNDISGISCLMPRGAFYAFPDCSELIGRSVNGTTIENSLQLCEALLEHARIAAVPGSAFGAEGFVRLHYAKSEEQIETALQRLQAFVGDHLD